MSACTLYACVEELHYIHAIITALSDIIKYRRLKWLGHVYRLPNEGLPKILLFGSFDGTGLQGRLIKFWNDCVQQALDSLDMSLTRKRTCQDRSA
jgi:hypothetical protein